MENPRGRGVAPQLVVIVDDSITNLKILERLAGSLGGRAVVQSFADWNAALGFCADDCPDLILLAATGAQGEAAAVARAFPNTPIVLNHTGFPWDRSEAGLAAWRQGMATLAREPNVHVKISEFGLRDRAWDYESNRLVVLEALAIFGIERAIFATNFPVAGLRIGYGELVAAMGRMVGHLPPADRDRFFWKNAKAFYRL